ncbi:MAG: hypothetical protein KF726_24650 [Anaerolineae bacterium]|nr:hypothetical protein [Anaerolineae bacterium]
MDKPSEPNNKFPRRTFLAALIPLPIAAVAWLRQVIGGQSATTIAAAPDQVRTATVTAPASAATVTATPILVPTPACGDDDDDDLTIAQTEGPYYTPNTPERTSLLEDGWTGTRMIVTGYVLGTDCKPVAEALLDFWHCDDKGVYDNVGYKYRGHQFTDAEGRYTLETVMPGIYTGRTRHFHVKVQAPNNPVLTTQLYFPDEPQNARDGIFNAALLMEVSDLEGEDEAKGKLGSFNFVLDVRS